MTSEKILAEILDFENLAIYDEDGESGNVFIGFIPEILQNEFDISLLKIGGKREIFKNTGARNDIITLYMRCADFELASEKLEEICSKLLNKSYITEDYIVDNIYVYVEPRYLEKNNDIYTFNCSLYITIETLESDDNESNDNQSNDNESNDNNENS